VELLYTERARQFDDSVENISERELDETNEALYSDNEKNNDDCSKLHPPVRSICFWASKVSWVIRRWK